MTDHDLAIDEILGATEGNQTDFDHGDETMLGMGAPAKGNAPAAGESAVTPDKKTAARGPRFGRLLLGLHRLLGGGFFPLEARQAPLPFDDLVCLLAHKEMK
mgnify:FL=1